MATAFGILCKDLICSTLMVKNKLIIDQRKNLFVNDAKMKNTTINGNLTLNGDLIISGNIIGEDACFQNLTIKNDINLNGNLIIGGNTCIDANCNLLDNFDPNQVKYPKGYICGLTMECSNSNVITIVTGACRDIDDCYNICATANIELNIFASGAGGLDTGSPNSFPGGTDLYGVYVIADKNETVPISGILSLDLGTPTLPPPYNKFRLVGYGRWKRFDGVFGEPRWVPFIHKGKGKHRHLCYDDLQLRQLALMCDASEIDEWETVRLSISGPPNALPPFSTPNFIPPGQCEVHLKIQYNNLLSGSPTITKLLLRSTGSKSQINSPGNIPSSDEVMFGAPRQVIMFSPSSGLPGPIHSQELRMCTSLDGEIDIAAFAPGSSGVVQLVVLGYWHEV